MTQELDPWKAREKLRSGIGWAAICVGLWGILVLGVAVSLFLFVMEFEVESTRLAIVISVSLFLAWGLALCACAVGLWGARAWARVTAACLLTLPLAVSVRGLANDGSIAFWLPFSLFPMVYLLLPSTERRFVRARGR